MPVNQPAVPAMRLHSLPRLTRIFAVLVAVCLAAPMALHVPGARAAKTPETAAEYYDSAVQLIAKGDLKGAVIQLKNALQRDPKDLSARVLLGRTYIDLEDGVSAEKELVCARRDGAQDSFVLLPLAHAYLLQGKYASIVKDINAVGQDMKTTAEIAVVRGDAFYAMRAYRNAETSYLEASKMRPNDAAPLLGLARVKLANDDMVGARNYIKWALQANPDDPTAWFVQGEVLEQAGKSDDALKSYDRAVALAPEFPRALLARAALRIDQGKHDQAEPDVLLVRKVSPQNARAAYLLSLILAHRGKVGEAQALLAEAEKILKGYPTAVLMARPSSVLLAGVVTYFRKDIDTSYRLLSLFLQQVPRHAGARKLLASIALTRNEPDVAMHLLAPLDPRRSKDIEVLTMVGDALARLKRYEEAKTVLKRAEDIAEPGSSALFKLVVVRLGAGQNADAIRLLQSEMERDPEAAQAAIMLGTAQMRSGDYKAALDTLASVTQRQPNNAVAHNLAGGALLSMGNLEDARKRYQAAVDAAPNYVHAIENLAKVEARLGNYDRATALFNGILEKDSRNGKVMIALADIARLRKNMDESFRWLEKARSASRDSEAAAFRLVDLYIGASRTDDALLVARQLYERGPGKFDNVLAFGRAQLAARKLEDAAATFATFATLAAESRSAVRLSQAASWQLQARDSKGAQQSLLKALSYDGDYLPAHLQMYGLEMSAEKFDAALERARKISAIDKASSRGHVMQGDVYMRTGRYDSAITAYDAALEKGQSAELVDRAYRARHAAGRDGLAFIQSGARGRGDGPVVQRMLATAFTDAGRHADALKIYEDLLKQAPNNISLLNNAALLYARTGDAKALDYAKRAYDAEPTEPLTMDTYGWVLVRLGRVDAGLTLLRNAKLRAPEIPDIRYHLAVALNASGKTQEAMEELRAALAFRRPFEEIADARALLARLGQTSR